MISFYLARASVGRKISDGGDRGTPGYRREWQESFRPTSAAELTQLPWTRNWEKSVFKENQWMAPKQDRGYVEGQVTPKGTERSH
jgi:hypothetical protein